MALTGLQNRRNQAGVPVEVQAQAEPSSQESPWLSMPRTRLKEPEYTGFLIKVTAGIANPPNPLINRLENDPLNKFILMAIEEYSKLNEDDEEGRLVLASLQQFIPRIRLLNVDHIYVRQRAPSYRKVSPEHRPWRIKYIGQQSIPNMNEVRCLECVKVVQVFSSNDLEPGDHIVICGISYNHHGILLSKEGESLEIMEATNTALNFLTGILRGFWTKAYIQITTKNLDFEKNKVCVVEYTYRYAKTTTIEKAKQFYSQSQKDGNYSYNLFRNNCEHFATNCATGQNFSLQVDKFKMMWGMFLQTGFRGFNDELQRNNAEFAKHLICQHCYEMNKYLLEVRVNPIVSAEDIARGDIIRYSYWNFWHEAVVLDKKEIGKNIVLCSIAHYSYFGPCSHRTIREEKIKIRLDGQCFKLDYNAGQYEVFEPDEVVRRARTRLGEQLFSFYANDSSHFVRWCKLRLLIPFGKLRHRVN